MVLDSVEEITEHNQSPGYEIGDHKLIFKNTYDSKEYGKAKKFTINAKDDKSPDAFYYVHIDVDLDQIEDCAEPRAPEVQELDAAQNEKLTSNVIDNNELNDEEPEKKKRR